MEAGFSQIQSHISVKPFTAVLQYANISVCMYAHVCMLHMCIFFYVAASQIIRPFVECFEKGTPNFLSVHPCKLILCMKHCIMIML